MVAFKLMGYSYVNGKVVRSNRRCTFKEAGEAMGGRDHTTVMHAIENIMYSFENQAYLHPKDTFHRKKIATIEKKINEKLLINSEMGRQIPEKYINKLFRSKAYVDKLKDKESEYVIWERLNGAKELHKKSDFSDEVLRGWEEDGKIYDAFIVPQKDMEEEFIIDFIISSYLNEDEDGEDK